MLKFFMDVDFQIIVAWVVSLLLSSNSLLQLYAVYLFDVLQWPTLGLASAARKGCRPFWRAILRSLSSAFSSGCCSFTVGGRICECASSSSTSSTRTLHSRSAISGTRSSVASQHRWVCTHTEPQSYLSLSLTLASDRERLGKSPKKSQAPRIPRRMLPNSLRDWKYSWCQTSQYCITLSMFFTNSYLYPNPTPPTNWDQEYTAIFSHPRTTLNLSKDYKDLHLCQNVFL